jgi:hypothetical protein
MNFIYETYTNQSTDRFFYADEGSALQAIRRVAEESAREHGVDFQITRWDADSLIVRVPVAGPGDAELSGHLFYMQRHPVL